MKTKETEIRHDKCDYEKRTKCFSNKKKLSRVTIRIIIITNNNTITLLYNPIHEIIKKNFYERSPNEMNDDEERHVKIGSERE